MPLYKLMLLYAVLLLGASSFDDDVPVAKVQYSRNFILKGRVKDGRNDSAFANKPLVIYGFGGVCALKTGPNGEYEVNFADTAAFEPSSYWQGNTTELLFGWGEDPNLTHTQSLKKLGIKKIKGEEKFIQPPKKIKLNFTLDFDFE